MMGEAILIEERWTERWFGSGYERGWSIWQAGHGDRIAYVGEGDHSERLATLICEKHNAAIDAARGFIGGPPGG